MPGRLLATIVCHGALCCQPAFWALVVLASAGLLFSLGSAAGVLRAAWLLAKVHLAIRRLPLGPVPSALREAATDASARRLRRLDSSSTEAFCAGVLWPRIYVSSGMLHRLNPEELRAVLLHEAAHGRRRDPARRALARAFAEAFFFVPVIRWWSRRHLEYAEVLADRAAIERLGPKPVASALLRLQGDRGLGMAPSFDGAAELRVAQVLGDPLPRRRPQAWHWLVSAVALGAILYLLFCPTAILLGSV